MPTVLLCKWQPRLVESLLAHDVSLYVVLDEFDVQFMNPDWDLLDKAADVYRISEFNSLEELAEVASDMIHRRIEVDHILSYTEFSQFGAGYLDILLRDGARSPLRHVATRDKRLMKGLVSEAGVPTADFVSLHSNTDAAVIETSERISYPAVVKPASGFGTMSTMRVDSKEEFRDHLTNFTPEPQVKSRQLIVEEFVTGRELYVDAFWRDGNSVFFVLSSYFEPRLSLVPGQQPTKEFINGGYVIPVGEDPTLHEAVLDVHLRVNEACGIRDGMTHLELFQRPDGELVFSEVASRIGGAWIPDVLTQALGKDVWEVLAGETLNLPESRPERGVPEFVGGISMKPRRPGRIVSMPTDAELATVEGLLAWNVVHAEGDVLELRHPSDYCAFAVIGASTRTEFEERVARLGDRVRIETVEVTGEPA